MHNIFESHNFHGLPTSAEALLINGSCQPLIILHRFFFLGSKFEGNL